MSRPADRLRALAIGVFPARTIERVIDPILADLQREYDEALARGGVRHARWSLVRSYVALARALFWLAVDAAWHADEAAELARTCLVSALASALITVVLALPPLLNYPTAWHGDPVFTALLFLTLIPQALPVSLPAGLCVAIVWVLRGKAATWRRAGMVLAIALASTAAVWVVLERIMPETNQAFREIVAARVSGRVVRLVPGLNELGLSRLAQRSDPAAVHQYRVLWTLCLSPVPLSLLALGLARFVPGVRDRIPRSRRTR